MNSLAHDVALWLVSQGVGTFGGTSGWSINVGVAPDVPDTVIALVDTGGEGADTDDQDIFAPSFQVLVRALSHASGYDKAREIRQLLLFMPALVTPSRRLSSVRLSSDIMSIGRDDNDRDVFSTNYEALTEED